MVGEEIVVDKKDVLAILVRNLVEHFFRWANVLGLLEVSADGAKLAREPAPPAELHECNGQVTFALKEIAAGLNASRLSHAYLRVVDRLQPVVTGVINHFRPAEFSVANIDGVRVRGTLLGKQGRMGAAKNDGNPAGPVFGSDLVGASGGVDLDADGDQVRRLIIGDLFHAIVEQHTIDIGRSQPGEDAQTERFHPRLIDIEAVLLAADVRHNEGDFHVGAPATRGFSGTDEPSWRPCLEWISRFEIRLETR